MTTLTAAATATAAATEATLPPLTTTAPWRAVAVAVEEDMVTKRKGNGGEEKGRPRRTKKVGNPFFLSANTYISFIFLFQQGNILTTTVTTTITTTIWLRTTILTASAAPTAPAPASDSRCC